MTRPATRLWSRAGELQVLRSGSGVLHSERNASAVEPVEYVQMWLRSDSPTVSYEQPALVRLTGGDLDVVSSDVTLDGAAHAYVVTGAALADGVALRAGDAVRVRDETLLLGVAGTVLVWRLSA